MTGIRGLVVKLIRRDSSKLSVPRKPMKTVLDAQNKATVPRRFLVSTTEKGVGETSTVAFQCHVCRRLAVRRRL